MVTVTPASDKLQFGDPIQLASGLRNGTTFAFAPGTGNLWIGENGIDGLVNPIEAFSADKLDVVPADKLAPPLSTSASLTATWIWRPATSSDRTRQPSRSGRSTAARPRGSPASSSSPVIPEGIGRRDPRRIPRAFDMTGIERRREPGPLGQSRNRRPVRPGQQRQPRRRPPRLDDRNRRQHLPGRLLQRLDDQLRGMRRHLPDRCGFRRI